VSDTKCLSRLSTTSATNLFRSDKDLKELQDGCMNAEKPSIFIKDKPIFSSERMLHKNYYRKDSVEKKISGRESQAA
jgi:hypothetical protein